MPPLTWFSGLVVAPGLVCTLTALSANAQGPLPSPLPPAAPQTVASDIGSAPPPPALPPRAMTEPVGNFDGTVIAYLLDPEAQVAGLLFSDGRQLRLPAHLREQVTALVKPGQRVRVTGLADRGDGRAGISVTALDSGKTLVDTPPDPSRAPPPPPPAITANSPLALMSVSGSVRQTLTAPRGEPDGVLLDSGVQVKIPPHAAARVSDMLASGTRLDVQGYGRRSAYGTVVQATSLARPGTAAVDVYGSQPPVRP